MSQAALLDPSKVLLLRHHRTARPRQLTCQWCFLQLEQRWNLVKPSPWRKASSSPGFRMSAVPLAEPKLQTRVQGSYSMLPFWALWQIATVASWVNSPRYLRICMFAFRSIDVSVVWLFIHRSWAFIFREIGNSWTNYGLICFDMFCYFD